MYIYIYNMSLEKRGNDVWEKILGRYSTTTVLDHGGNTACSDPGWIPTCGPHFPSLPTHFPVSLSVCLCVHK